MKIAFDAGELPLGRWTCTAADLDDYAQQGDIAHRERLLAAWRELTEAVRTATGSIAACWLGGSFFSDKRKPSDLDCVYVIDRNLLMKAKEDPQRAGFLQVVASNQVKAYWEIPVDTFILDWWPRPGIHWGSPDREHDYLASRGYWDDLWLRKRDYADLRLDSVPRRGYLEVILDGYK